MSAKRKPAHSTEKGKAEMRRRKHARMLAAAPLRMGHESMLALKPVRSAVTGLVEELRVSPGDPVRLVQEQDLIQCPEVTEMLRARHEVCKRVFGWDDESCILDTQQLVSHVKCAADFELAGRKAFWVSPELSEQLRNTNLDVSDEALLLPFPACTFCFSDPATLELMQGAAVGAYNPDFKLLSVYVAPVPEDQGGDGLRFTFLADPFDGEWPYILARDVVTEGSRNLDEILDSHPEGSSDELFRTPELRELVKLVVNAVLYTTCSDFQQEPRSAPRSRTGNTPPIPLSGETVFFLPGKILIDHENRGATPDDASTRTVENRRILKRFWVRGHWRRANPTWQDQRLRWVKPYLKGPEMTAIVERQYQVGIRRSG